MYDTRYMFSTSDMKESVCLKNFLKAWIFLDKMFLRKQGITREKKKGIKE